MKIISAESALAKVRRYLANDVVTPFFVVVDDSIEYSAIIAGLSALVQVRASEYCANDDAYPDIDALCDKLTSVAGNTLLLGCGESTSLCGNENVMGRLKDLNVSAKVVVVCRGIRGAVRNLCKEDKKFNSRRVCFLRAGASYEIIKFPSVLAVSAIDGFKELLLHLENGASGPLFVKTALKLHRVREVYSAFAGQSCF